MYELPSVIIQQKIVIDTYIRIITDEQHLILSLIHGDPLCLYRLTISPAHLLHSILTLITALRPIPEKPIADAIPINIQILIRCILFLTVGTEGHMLAQHGRFAVAVQSQTCGIYMLQDKIR